MISLFAKVAPVYSPELVLDDTLRREERMLYQAGSLRTHGDVPLLVDHDPELRVGTVRELVEFPDTDGRWHAVIADVDDRSSRKAPERERFAGAARGSTSSSVVARNAHAIR